MPRRVRGPDGIVHTFPDDASDAEIAEALGGDAAPRPRMNMAVVNGLAVPVEDDVPPSSTDPSRVMSAVTWLRDHGMDLLPSVGATIGGSVAGIPGAGIGGAAGKGYRDVIQQAREVPAALMDVFRGLRDYPAETLRGGVAGVAQGVKDTGLEGALQAVYELGGQAVTKGLSSGARAVYRSVLKPSLAAKEIGKAEQIVNTAIAEGLPISKGGAATTQRLIGELKQEVDGILQQSQGTVDLHQVAERVRAWARAKYYRPGAAMANFDAAMKVADSIDKHPSLGLPAGARATRVDVSLPAANEVKRSLGSDVAESFGAPGAKGSKASGKYAYSAMRREIENQAGGPTGRVATLNARESRLIDAAKAINRAVAREANQYSLHGWKSMTAAVVGAGSAAAGEDPASSAALALAIRAGLHPAVASRAAIVASRLAKTAGVSAAAAARVAVSAVSAEKEPDQNDER